MLLDSFLTVFKWDGHEAEQGAKGLEEQFESLKHTVESIAHIETFRFLKEMIMGVVEKVAGVGEMAEHIQNMAYSAGIAAEELQKLQYSAQQSGLGADDVSMAMTRLSRSMQEARMGSKQAIELFSQVGISYEQVSSFKNGGDALLAIADHMKAVTDPTKRTAIATQLLGRNAAGAVRWLSKGAAGIKEMGEEGAKMGAIIKTEDLNVLEETADEISSIWLIVKGFTATILSVVAPSIRGIVGHLKEWWSANRAIIQQGMEHWLGQFLYWLGYVVGVVQGLIRFTHDWAESHKELIENIKLTAKGFRDDLVNAVLSAKEGIVSFVKEHETALATLGEYALAVGAVAAGYWLISGVPGTAVALASAAISTFETILLKGMYALEAFNAGLAAMRAFLTGIGGQVMAVAFAVVALWKSAKSVYDLFHGVQWKDTDLGKIFGEGSGDILKALGLAGQEGTSFEVGPDGKARPKKGTPLAGAGNFGTLWNMAGSVANTSTAAAAAVSPLASVPPSVTQNISVPMTINNAPADADPKVLQAMMERTVKDALTQTAVRAQRAVKSPVRM